MTLGWAEGDPSQAPRVQAAARCPPATHATHRHAALGKASTFHSTEKHVSRE